MQPQPQPQPQGPGESEQGAAAATAVLLRVVGGIDLVVLPIDKVVEAFGVPQAPCLDHRHYPYPVTLGEERRGREGGGGGREGGREGGG